MSDPTIQVHPGNISTYEGASDDYLTKRKTDLRSSIRNPHLSAGEFVQGVVSQALIAGAALGYSAWFGLGNLLPKFGQSRLAKDMGFELRRKDEKGNGRTFAFELDTHRIDFRDIGANWARFYFEGLEGGAQSTLEMARTVEGIMHKRRFTTGLKDLQMLIKEISDPACSLTEVEKRAQFLDVCHNAYLKHEDAYLAKLFDMITSIDTEFHGGSVKNAEVIMERMAPKIEAFFKELSENNAKIIDRYRLPVVALGVAGAVAVTGARAYRVTQRDKMLSEETEISHIERLQDERSKRQDAAPEQSTRA